MNIYVSNLSFDVSETELQSLFGQFGTVTSTKLINDKFTGESRGFGFVEMSSEEEGQTAISSLNEREVGGRQISVAVARPKERSNTSQFARPRSPWNK
jgi:RNA recognition motif-containing protein